MDNNEKQRRRVICVTGPTATGKTSLAVRLARRFNGEIISVDSRQVYVGMDIGTGKDLAEYGETPYHLIDVAIPGREVYNLQRFCLDAYRAIDDITSRGKLPILCGGTALYLEALLLGYDLPGDALPARENGIPREQQTGTLPSITVPFGLDALTLGVYFERKTVRSRIEQRLDARLSEGMVDEVEALHRSGVTYEQLEFFGLEYREIARYLQGKCSHQEMRDQLLDRIRQFAKRQDIFFRKMERENIIIHWLRSGSFPEAEKLVSAFLSGETLPDVQFKLIDIVNGPSY